VSETEGVRSVVFCTPTITRPYQQFLDAMEAAVPALDAAGIKHQIVFEAGSAYISHARATMLRKALDTQPDAAIFLDHDLGFTPDDLLRLIQTPGDVVAGTYRFKQPKVEYMGTFHTDAEGYPVLRDDGCIHAEWVPAGFLKVTAHAVNQFMGAYPELVYGPRYRPSIDLFNHGAHGGVWYGEDYAFSRRWNDQGGQIWLIPGLDLIHYGADGTPHGGSLRDHLRRQPGGDLAEAA
jgi:glycosyltransferase involved in cell wall biosynthesis